MIRILTTEEPGTTTITIDGRLVADYVDEVETTVRRAMDQQKKTRLFLRNVVHMDDAGRSLLSSLSAQGIELSAAGIYSSYIVEQIVK
jgi:ABC-type transporter Mla MlaB component